MNTLGVGMKFYRKHCGHTAFHVLENKNFTKSSGVWTGGCVTMGDYGRLKTHRIPE
jgi:hypothetical protein